jgi:hypothetical protein
MEVIIALKNHEESVGYLNAYRQLSKSLQGRKRGQRERRQRKKRVGKKNRKRRVGEKG